MKSFKSPEAYIENHPEWQETLMLLRGILLETTLEENIKWGAPVYSLNGKNVVGIGAFKSYAGLWFFQGSFLSDPDQVLINAQKGVTKGLRQWRFSSLESVQPERVKAYVLEAIENEKKGLRIKVSPKPLVIPELLETALNSNERLKASFESFTPGKQKEFANYILEVKREETKANRLEKIIPLIAQGIGLNDKYR